MKIMAFATALTLALGALTLPFSESGYNFAYKAAASAQAGTNDFKYDSADIFTADSLLDRAILPDGERIFDHDPILAYTPTTRDWLFKQTAEEVVDNSWLISADTLWLNAEKAFSFEFVGEDSVFTRQQFVYETIIMDYLTYQYQSDEFKSDIEKSTTKFMYKIEKKVLDNEILSDEAFDNKIKGMSKEDAADFAKEQNYLKRFNEVNVSAYDSLIDGAETAKDYFKKLSKLMALQEASTTRLDFLQKIKDNTDDKALIKAIDDITAKYNDELSNVVWNEFLQTGMETFNGVVWDSIKDFFKKKFKIEIPGFSNIKLGMAGIDWAFNEKGMAESRIQLTILYIIHADVMQTYIDMRDSYINSGTEESAQEFVNAYSQYLAFIAYSSGITKEYLGETLIDGAYNSIKNLFSSTNQTAYNDYCSALNSEISICQTLDKYVGLAKDFYNKMSGYNTSEDTKVPESAAIGTRFTSGYLTYEVTGEGEVKVARCDSSAVNVYIPEYILYNDYSYMVTEIGPYAFAQDGYINEYDDNYNLSTVSIPNSVKNIDVGAFYKCRYLKSVNLPSDIKTINEYTFRFCNSLTNITIPDSVQSIGDMAFENCCSLSDVVLPDNVISIGRYSFDSCYNLSEISIPDSTFIIGEYSFYNCKNIRMIEIGYNVENIGFLAFGSCEKLTNIMVDSKNKYYSSDDGILFNKNQSEIIQYPCANERKNYNIPNSVTTIGHHAFSDCSNLLNIFFPNSVESIENYAFSNCDQITSVFISRSIRNIGEGIFYNCEKLTTVVLPKNISEIGYRTFYNCKSLKNITLTENITTIGVEAFYGCSCLEYLIIPTSMTTINSDSFFNCTSLTDVYYTGSADDWAKIRIDDENGKLTNANIHYNYVLTHTHSYIEEITKQPTCTEEGKKTFTCDCGDTYTEIIPAKGHTEVIDKAVPATCTTDGKTEGSHCYVCGKVIKAQTVIKATGHKYDDGKITKQPTCTETGVKTYTCSECGATKAETIKANGHTEVIDKAVPATCTTDGKTEGSHCSVCGEVIKAQTVIKATGHKYDDGKITKQPTCTETGVKTYTCSECGATKAETIKANGHTEVIDKAVPATCTTDGKTEGSHCSVCGEVIKAQTVIKATGHKYDDGKITKQPTCTAEGVKTYTCLECGDIKTETIKANGHTEVIDKAVPATCTTDGKTEGSHCYICGEVIKAQTVIKATGHKYDDGKITKQPTCTETGVKTYTCSECGATKAETIKANGHTEVIDKAVPATCTTDGKTEGSHCSVCGEVIKAQTVIKATGHNFGSWSTTKAATCTESGTQTRKCASCGKTETKTIPAKGHKSSGWIIDKTASIGVKGSKHKECTVCKKVLETAEIPALSRISISKASVTLSTSTYAYDGKAKKPGVTVKLNGKTLKNGTDYTVSYSNNTKVGTATVKITGKGNYTGSVSKTFKIKNNFKKATVLGISNKSYTGKNITQSITVKYNGKTLKNGTDYTVSYSSNKNIGTATVKIAGKDSYTGTITKTFKINPAKQEIQKLTAKSKAFFVDWAQKESATGYEIQYATNSKFSGAKKVTVTNNKTDKKTISKLSGKKKYYVRVRSYTTVKGKKYYGAWSSTKSVTTKK